MKGLHLIAIALLAAPSIACAEGAQNATALYESWTDRDQKAATSSQTLSGFRHNPNACAPDRAEPVWNSMAGLLGYTCSHNENGG